VSLEEGAPLARRRLLCVEGLERRISGLSVCLCAYKDVLLKRLEEYLRMLERRLAHKAPRRLL
jgi:hypothetical protein